MSVTELASAMKLHPSTVSRLLGALETYDLVMQEPVTQYFQIGPRCYQLGQVFISRVEVAAVAEPFMRNLTARIGQSTHIGVLSGAQLVRVKHVEPEGYLLRLSASERYAPGELHCEALGKVLLAHQPDDVVERILDSMLYTKYTATTITSKAAMRKEIEVIRRQGYAFDNGERFPNVRCVAVPIWDHTNHVAAGLSASGSDREIKAQRAKKLAGLLWETAEVISKRMGASRSGTAAAAESPTRT
jgi:DNA-binding IclR family transcriptional regulator